MHCKYIVTQVKARLHMHCLMFYVKIYSIAFQCKNMANELKFNFLEEENVVYYYGHFKKLVKYNFNVMKIVQ